MEMINLEKLNDEELRALIKDGQEILDRRDYEKEMKRKMQLISNLRKTIEEILSYGYVLDISNETDPNYWLRLGLNNNYTINLE